MKYAIIEAQNWNLIDHESGLDLTDGDADEEIYISRIGRVHDSKNKARHALEKHLDDVENAIKKSGQLHSNWRLIRGPDLYQIGMEKLIRYDDGDYEIEDYEWIAVYNIVEIPERDDEVNEHDIMTLLGFLEDQFV